jgi:hypothetical protein
MKMDKETLLKNRFWVGLVVFGPLWLIILIIALVSSGSEAATKKKEMEDASGKLKAISNPKNERFTVLVEEKKNGLQAQKDKVWAEAWKGQKDLMKWPEGMDGRAQLEANGYFGDALTPGQRTQFRDAKNYATQLPVSPKGENRTMVAPNGEPYIDKLLAPNGEISADWDRLIHKVDFTKADKDPTDEEVWLSQEDIWVQREMVNIVRSALDSASRFENVAHFKHVEIPKSELDKLSGAAAPAAPAGGATAPAAAPAPGAEEAAKKQPVVIRQRFHTPHWRLDLVMEQNDKKELSATTQTALYSIDAPLPTPGLDIRLWQNSARPSQPQLLHFQGGKAGTALALEKAVPLPGFATNFDDLPLEVDIVADKSEPPLPPNTRRLVYRNPNWQLELVIVQEEGKQPVLSNDSKLTNINSTRRTLSLAAAMFRVYQGDRLITDITPPGEWLAWSKTAPVQKASLPPSTFTYDPRFPVQVAQLFNPFTSPVVRINAFEIPGSPECVSFNSHRTANLQLIPAAQFPVEAPKEGGAGGGGDNRPGGGLAGMSGMSGGRGGPMGAGTGGTGGGGDAAANDGSRTPNGLINRNRYIAVTEQVRHMPVALSLTVEQAHVQDVLAAVANSRLRIQVTQVQWKRAEGLKRGEQVASGASGRGTGGGGGLFPGGMLGGSGSGRGPAAPPPPAGGMSGSDARPGGRGGMSGASFGGPPVGGMSGTPFGGMGGFTGGGYGTPTVEQNDPNLIEVAVYGIAALYERYPPKPPKTEGAPAGTNPPAAAPEQPNK